MNTIETTPVTVIALCYNHERFVTECLESIRLQSFQKFQLIVTDDCSSDSSPELIATWLEQHYPDAIFLRHQKNVGICRTLNEALSHACGEYVSMIATDDVWEPLKIEHQLSVMQRAPKEVAVVYSDTTQIDEEGNLLPQTFLEFHLDGRAPPTGELLSSLADRNFIPAMATLIRREAILAVGGYDDRLIYEDYDMWLRLAANHKFFFIPGLVAKYRILSTSMVRSKMLVMNPDYLYSQCLIGEKWITSKIFSADQSSHWAGEHWGMVYKLYCCDDSRAVKSLLKSAFYCRKIKPIFLAAALLMGLTRTRLKTISLVFK